VEVLARLGATNPATRETIRETIDDVLAGWRLCW
jgi:hypothetical protein